MENWNLHPEYESEAQIHELKIETIMDHNAHREAPNFDATYLVIPKCSRKFKHSLVD